MRLRTLILFFCLSSAVAAAETHTFYIGLSAKERLKRQDWSGRAEISNGRIVSVQKDSGPMDKVHPDMSWTIIYGRGLRNSPPARRASSSPSRARPMPSSPSRPRAAISPSRWAR